jgi:hypothetical protein
MADHWWKRRWIFQEEYCSSGKMQLLIPHMTEIEKDGMQETLGAVPGEVLIKAANFRKQVTLFCLACFRSAIFRTRGDRRRCADILRKAKAYRLLPKYGWIVRDDSLGRAMSTRILGDISRRTAKKPEDTLAIQANCCGYTVRLDSQKLGASSESLSVAMIALFLLNGEILWNDRRQIAAGTVFGLLKELSFNEFDPPTDEKRLTFMKKCRLVNVFLTESGIKTTGHLWYVQKEIRTKQFRMKQPQRTDNEKRACLHRFAAQLERSHPQLAQNLYRCQHEAVPESRNEDGLQEIYRKMVSVLDEAVLSGKKLLVARLMGSSQNWAIFISHRRAKLQQSFVFTAYESAEYSEIVKRYRSAVKYVSLLVSMHARTAQGLPRLQIGGWVNGLPFPEKKSPTEVIFPWPDAIERLIIS